MESTKDQPMWDARVNMGGGMSSDDDSPLMIKPLQECQ